VISDGEQFITASGLAHDNQLLEKKSTSYNFGAHAQESEDPMASRVRAFFELLENEHPLNHHANVFSIQSASYESRKLSPKDLSIRPIFLALS
jgi:hypothetical protein